MYNLPRNGAEVICPSAGGPVQCCATGVLGASGSTNRPKGERGPETEEAGPGLPGELVGIPNGSRAQNPVSQFIRKPSTLSGVRC